MLFAVATRAEPSDAQRIEIGKVRMVGFHRRGAAFFTRSWNQNAGSYRSGGPFAGAVLVRFAEPGEPPHGVLAVPAITRPAVRLGRVNLERIEALAEPARRAMLQPDPFVARQRVHTPEAGNTALKFGRGKLLAGQEPGEALPTMGAMGMPPQVHVLLPAVCIGRR